MSESYLLIIDGSSLLSTQFYGNLPPAVLMAKTAQEKEKYFPRIMQTSGGVYTNGIFGFLRYLLKVLRQQKPTHLAVCWDLTRETFRRRLSADYKANRSETIVPLKEQFALCQEILKRIGVKQFMSEEFEADDYSGSLAARFEGEIPVRILTKDHDYLQLADGNTTIWLLQQAQKKADELFTKYGIRKEAPFVSEKAFPMTPDRIESEFGVRPESVAELKALQGDTSDNIKGVPGIGAKTALSLIAHYKTIDALYDAVHEAGADGEKALATFFKTELGITKNPIPTLVKEDPESLTGEAAARLSRTLATIKRDIPLSENLADLSVNIDYPELRKILAELEIKTIPLPEADVVKRADVAVTEVAASDVKNTLAAIAGCDSPCAIIQTTSAADAEDWQVAFGLTASEFVLTVAQADRMYRFRCPQDEAESLVADAVSAMAGKVVYCFDAKGSWRSLPGSKLTLRDIGIMDYLIRPLEAKHTPEDVFPEWNGEMPKEDQLAMETLLLGEALWKKLGEQGMERLFTEIEMPLVPILAGMEDAGVLVDTAQLGAFAAFLRTEIDRETRTIYNLCGTEFNINSPKQLAEVLFEKLAIPYPEKKKKTYSTSVDILEKLRADYPVVDAVLRYRGYAKLYSTYAEGLHAYIAADGRIHTTFTQTVTATGRLSSVDPNLQNIPARTELGRDIRKAFVPKDGCVFVDADYSQIELRLMAHLSGDKNLQNAYHKAADIHRLTASQVLGIPYDEVTPQQRGAAKAVNFGILYGISAFSLAQDLGITRAAAEEYIASYYKRFPQVRDYLDRTIADAKKNGYVKTLYGRVRPIPQISSQSYQERMFGERVAMNSPIQGTAADIMKAAMIAVDKALREGGFKAKMLLQVHDEVLLECPREEAEAVAKLVQTAMEGVADLAVPLVCEVHTGENWLDAKD
ncbi:MAG: DNA polymerase I [Lachnospiraceae bacterium]|nr:DNA polymerase I [Lachnospiraceae bacterium]